MTILFLTDGLATEGVVETDLILENIEDVAPDNVRIFTFGVGNDVDTVLLDSITRDFRGASSYVRPGESITEEVGSLYNKVSAPVLTDLELDLGDIRTDFVYPNGQLPDLFAGEQLTVVGRYRQGEDNINITLSGEVNGEATTFVYEGIDFRDRAGGEPFIARLWATRRIGELLNTIRLRGEDDELVNSVVSLSLRYGIITPYTSFLIEEDDILSQTGRDDAEVAFRQQAQGFSANASGAAAVDAADAFGSLEEAQAPLPAATQTRNIAAAPAAEPNSTTELADSESVPADGDFASGGDFGRARADFREPLISVGDKTFILQNDIYTDTTFEPDNMTPEEIVFLSDAYFDLLVNVPELAQYLAIADELVVVYDGIAYKIVIE
jgi:Ca-activated chloride channel family protein